MNKTSFQNLQLGQTLLCPKVILRNSGSLTKVRRKQKSSVFTLKWAPGQRMTITEFLSLCGCFVKVQLISLLAFMHLEHGLAINGAITMRFEKSASSYDPPHLCAGILKPLLWSPRWRWAAPWWSTETQPIDMSSGTQGVKQCALRLQCGANFVHCMPLISSVLL